MYFLAKALSFTCIYVFLSYRYDVLLSLQRTLKKGSLLLFWLTGKGSKLDQSRHDHRPAKIGTVPIFLSVITNVPMSRFCNTSPDLLHHSYDISKRLKIAIYFAPDWNGYYFVICFFVTIVYGLLLSLFRLKTCKLISQ